jgi:hypothetical protein
MRTHALQPAAFDAHGLTLTAMTFLALAMRHGDPNDVRLARDALAEAVDGLDAALAHHAATPVLEAAE